MPWFLSRMCLLEIKPWWSWLPFPHQVLKKMLNSINLVLYYIFLVKSMNSAPPLLVIIGELGWQGRHRAGSLPPHSAWRGHRHCALQTMHHSAMQQGLNIALGVFYSGAGIFNKFPYFSMGSAYFLSRNDWDFCGQIRKYSATNTWIAFTCHHTTTNGWHWVNFWVFFPSNILTLHYNMLILYSKVE